MARKTFEVRNALDRANAMLMHPERSADFKMGVALMIEGILHDAGVYAGFCCMDESYNAEMREANRIFSEEGGTKAFRAALPANNDPRQWTRTYSIHRKLRD